MTTEELIIPAEPKSKRTPVRLRHKIEKASAAKQRKQRKLAKQNPQWRSRIKKDPGIPNLFPYKDKILADVEESRRQKMEDQQKRREEARARRNGTAVGDEGGMDVEGEDEDLEDDFSDELEDEEGDAAMNDSNDADPMAALLASARSRAQEFDLEGEEEESGAESERFEQPTREPNSQSATPQSHTKALNELIAASDTLLHVLDARDPLATLSRPLTSRVTSEPSKRLLLILNKIDLVPSSTAQKWLSYLRTIFPVLPLIASKPASGARTFDHVAVGWTAQSTSAALLKALKAQASNKGMKRAVSVGVLGLPNVGKSSVINALTAQLGGRKDTCPTGAEAGVTRALRVVKIDSTLKILDGPGVVLEPEQSGAKKEKDRNARLALLAALPPANIDDPVPSVTLLLRRLESMPDEFAILVEYYGLPALIPGADATTDFLVQVARKRGRLGKGGVPNLHAAALTVLGDWRDGRVAGWVEAPAGKGSGVSGGLTQAEGQVRDQKKLVKEWAEEFKIEGLWNDRPGDAAVITEEIEMVQ